jgi:predicted tellurium resistance membrane protein TerC
LLGSPVWGRDLVLLVGGLFLIGKAAHEIYEKTEAEEPADDSGAPAPPAAAGFAMTLVQILALDIVFSLDSVITAVGMARAVVIMVTAMIIAVGVMLVFADAVSEFINRHPSMRVLALSFLLLIGVLLVSDAFDKHINKGYVYFAMAFSFAVELLNIRGQRKRRRPRRENDAPPVAPRSAP